ncbi:hypothetical protein [Lacticaseibacillus brantae]|nr:hypothetical protein [Lacticaseibacillus brantae]
MANHRFAHFLSYVFIAIVLAIGLLVLYHGIEFAIYNVPFIFGHRFGGH